jgi:hypothetical protein
MSARTVRIVKFRRLSELDLVEKARNAYRIVVEKLNEKWPL